MEPTTLVLVRHGESVGNRERRFGGHGPTPLTELGHDQARATAAAIGQSLEPTALISSDLVRARQTADAISAETGLDLELEPGMRERSLGVLDNLLFTEAQTRYPELWERLIARDPTVKPPGGETVTEVFARVGATIDRIVAAHPGGRVVVVSHGLAMYHAFAHICGLGDPAVGLQVFVLVDNCSVSTYRHRDGGWRILGVNDCTHLVRAGLQ